MRLKKLVFGNQAIVDMHCMAGDPWFCVPGFHRVCLYRSIKFEGTDFQKTEPEQFPGSSPHRQYLFSAAWQSGHLYDTRPIRFTFPALAGFAICEIYY
jgi:hypothetical protein